MSDSHPHLRPFVVARDRFTAGGDSPRDYLERCLERIAEREPTVHAFVELDIDIARAAAEASTARYLTGRPRSLLDGCPVGIKDIIETADFPTQMNSPFYQGWRSGRDAACVRALRQAGAIVLGKTQTTEFAVGAASPCTNPHDAARTPGGSSSGSAAAVGSGMLPVALGTQTAGSILRPASFCGAYGFKPTQGLLSLAGVHPLSRTLDTLGPIAASLEDAWAVTHAIWSALGGARAEQEVPGDGTLPEPRRPRRLAVLRTDGWASLDAASIEAFEAWIDGLRARGVEVVDAGGDAAVGALDSALVGVNDLNLDIIRFEIRYPMTLYRDLDPNGFGERLRGLLAEGDAYDAERHRASLAARDRLRARVAGLAGHVDGFLSLASTGPAPVGLDFTGDRTFLAPWSVVGGPAFSLPLLEVDGLPVGVQLMGFDAADAALAATARWITAG
ncbi:MAG: amidase [Ectothiorhodospiraceae bacterium]|nr:amidase [Chromatiales bacterium]MCP5156959.1 amidase [Ectothiorhodospiraceae bacterium]